MIDVIDTSRYRSNARGSNVWMQYILTISFLSPSTLLETLVNMLCYTFCCSIDDDE